MSMDLDIVCADCGKKRVVLEEGRSGKIRYFYVTCHGCGKTMTAKHTDAAEAVREWKQAEGGEDEG